jgi:hypothetical protein
LLRDRALFVARSALQFLFNWCDFAHSQPFGLGSMNGCYELMSRRRGYMIPRPQPSMLLRFLQLNMSLYAHALCCAIQKFFGASSDAQVLFGCVGPESWRIHACMYSAGRMAPRTGLLHACRTTYACMHVERRINPRRAYSYVHDLHGRNGFAQRLYSDSSHTCMSCEARLGQCPALIMNMCVYRVPASHWDIYCVLCSHITLGHISCIVFPHHIGTYIGRCLRVWSWRHF